MARVAAVSERTSGSEIKAEVKKIQDKALADKRSIVEAGKTYNKIIDSAMGKTEYHCRTAYKDTRTGEIVRYKSRIICILKGAKVQFGDLKLVPADQR